MSSDRNVVDGWMVSFIARLGLAGASSVLFSLYLVALPLLSHIRKVGATMKTITFAFCLTVSAYGIALASESRHAAIVDMPEVATLSHASPDTWHTLPPVQPNDVRTTTALLFAQVVPVEPRCNASPGDHSRNSVSLVEFF